MHCFAGLATSAEAARAVPSCSQHLGFGGHGNLKHTHKKRKTVSTHEGWLKPASVVGRLLRLKHRVSCAISMVLPPPCSGCEMGPRPFLLSRYSSKTGFFEAITLPFDTAGGLDRGVALASSAFVIPHSTNSRGVRIHAALRIRPWGRLVREFFGKVAGLMTGLCTYDVGTF